MANSDILQAFLFQDNPVRGQIGGVNHTFQTILQQQNYPPIIKYLLGEALMSALLLTGSIKFEGELSLQFQGDDRFPFLLVQCNHQLNLRGYAKYRPNLAIEDYGNAFIEGKMAITINQYQKTASYQSIVPIISTSMSENLMHYFAQSEQLSTRVWLAVNEHRAAGMMLQLMPGQDSTQLEQFWEYAVRLGETIREEELLNLNNTTILHRLYHETDVVLFDERSVHFRCKCNKEKMRQVIQILGQAEAEQLLKEKGNIEVSCDFCSQTFTFDAIDTMMIFK